MADFLDNAKAHYGFVPTPTTEREFKRRYAEEALAVGLTKDQVVRIYALETGGQGTYDMQSGINPITKQGRPISSALGYAQLLHANSTSELRQARRELRQAPAGHGGHARHAARARRRTAAKAAILRRMLRAARSVPNEWGEHVRFGGTPPGLGIHALNLDADVGPWLQVLKLKGLKDDAAQAGRPKPDRRRDRADEPRRAAHGSGDDDAASRSNMPTSNFFSEGGYYRNTIVREKTAPSCCSRWKAAWRLHLRSRARSSSRRSSTRSLASEVRESRCGSVERREGYGGTDEDDVGGKERKGQGYEPLHGWECPGGRRRKCVELIACPRKTALKGAVSVCGRELAPG